MVIAQERGARGRFLAMPVADRFWGNVDRGEPDECWLWRGTRSGRRAFAYGCLWINAKPRYAHRLSYELTRGAIPDGLNVLHRCDIPLCVNPAHLFIGTQRDNVHDAIKKGRLLPARHARLVRAIRLAKPLCHFGHPFDRVSPRGKRYCSTCVRLNSARRRARRHAAIHSPQNGS